RRVRNERRQRSRRRTGDDTERQWSVFGIGSGECDEKRRRVGGEEDLRIRSRRLIERAVDREFGAASDENVAREECAVSFDVLFENERAGGREDRRECFAAFHGVKRGR